MPELTRRMAKVSMYPRWGLSQAQQRLPIQDILSHCSDMSASAEP